MSERNETLADIVAELRSRGSEITGLLVPDGGGRTRAMTPELADRIEAAWNEERRILVADAENAKDARNRIGIKLRQEFADKCKECMVKVGNAAKLRDALRSMVRQEHSYMREEEIDRDVLCGRCTHSAIMFKDCKHDGNCWVDKVWAALAAPPRNCDVGTAVEQGARFFAFCKANRTPANECSPRCPFKETAAQLYCITGWGQLAYEEKGGGR